MKYIQQPTLLTVSLFDDWAISSIIGQYGPPYSNQQSEVALDFADRTIHNLEELSNENDNVVNQHYLKFEVKKCFNFI